MSLLTIFLLGASLSMDALAVSVCAGIILPKEKRLHSGLSFGLWFGFFQFFMPVLGYYLAASFYQYIAVYDHWIAFFLLAYIGVKMLKEANAEVSGAKAYTTTEMFFLALATSIDALAVGIGLMFLSDILFPAFLIGLTTFVFSFLGCTCGTYIGALGKEKAERAGGVVLICLGLKILIEHLGLLS